MRDPAGRAARLSASDLPDEKVIEELFLASLSRLPTAEERGLLIDKLRKSGTGRHRVVEDILWASRQSQGIPCSNTDTLKGLQMSQKNRYSRRDFVKASAVTAGVAALALHAYARVLGANGASISGVIGLGVMGSGHLHGLKRQQESLNLDVLQTCDVYRKRAEKAANSLVDRPSRSSSTRTFSAIPRSMPF